MSEASESEPLAFGRFFLPGPTEVRPEVLRAQVRAMFGHRDPPMKALMEELQDGLRDVFRTDRPVVVSTSSATGLMEAAIRNGVRDRVLCLVNGAFAERFAAIARACARDVDLLEVPWGAAHDPEEVRRLLRERRYDAVTVVHSETSTGVLQPLEELARVVGGHDGTLLLVDAVTAVGGAPVLTDAWGLDFVLTGSQKALALPPGLAFGVASESMIERAVTVPARGAYFDLVAFHENLVRSQTPNTPALSLLHALAAQLRRMAAEGMEGRWERHRRMAERCAAWVEGREGPAVLAGPGYRSPTVTCIRLPEGMRGPEVVAGLAARGIVIGGGYGKLGEATVRIGHMGDHTVEELDEVLEALGDVMDERLEASASPAPVGGSASTSPKGRTAS